MYHASCRANAGEASALEASAITTASFRILIPFLDCHYGQRKLPNGSLVSTQGNKIRGLLHNRHSSADCPRGRDSPTKAAPCAASMVLGSEPCSSDAAAQEMALCSRTN